MDAEVGVVVDLGVEASETRRRRVVCSGPGPARAGGHGVKMVGRFFEGGVNVNVLRGAATAGLKIGGLGGVVVSIVRETA